MDIVDVSVSGDFNDDLAQSTVSFGSLEETVTHAEILFVAVQTPHDPRYEGITPLPAQRVDFDYTYLRSAVRSISEVCRKPTIVVIISTVLPGTIKRPACSPCSRSPSVPHE